MAKKEFWEVPEINLNFLDKKYKGKSTDAIKELKYSIEQYLARDDISQQNREIYSAIYNALNYYTVISYNPSQEFDTNDTFLKYACDEINYDFLYLLGKYNQKYPDNTPNKKPIIEISARIKSPISYLTKVKKQITQSLDNNDDLSCLNDRLKDLFGVQIIVNPPKSICDRGHEA